MNDFLSQLRLCSAVVMVSMLLLTAGMTQAADRVFVEQQKLVQSDGTAGDQFGVDLAISGDVAVVGSSEKNGKEGRVYL
ncbi:MAG TPA: hypothetical protein EYP34_14650 [Chromatiaceae bacterium]|nr:hypothetical protein [Chromatiaceae bacterium]